MKMSKGAEALPADPQESLAANEDFREANGDHDPLTPPQCGWDPYAYGVARVKTCYCPPERARGRRATLTGIGGRLHTGQSDTAPSGPRRFDGMRLRSP